MFTPIYFTSKIIDFSKIRKNSDLKPAQQGLSQDVFERKNTVIDNQLSLEEAQSKKKDPLTYFILKIDEKNQELQRGLVKAEDIVQDFIRPLIKSCEIENTLIQAHKDEREDDLETFYDISGIFFPFLLKCLEDKPNLAALVESLSENIDDIYWEYYPEDDTYDEGNYFIHVNETEKLAKTEAPNFARQQVREVVDEAYTGSWSPQLSVTFDATKDLNFNMVKQYLEWMLEAVKEHMQQDDEICKKAGYTPNKEDEE